MEILKLEALSTIVTAFSPVQCNFLVENCIVTLENQQHAAGCQLSVKGDDTTQFVLDWELSVNKAGYQEPKKTTEHAAEAISFFLSHQLTEYKVVEEGLIGTGIDYWLGYDESHARYDPINFLQARLEISGIKAGNTSNSLERRVKEKQQQTVKSDATGLPAYVSVVEFSAPQAYFGKK